MNPPPNAVTHAGASSAPTPPPEYEYVTRNVLSSYQAEQLINQLSPLGWELQEQSAAKANLGGNRYIILTFRRDKGFRLPDGGPAPAAPPQSCCSACATAALAIVAVVGLLLFQVGLALTHLLSLR